MEIMGLLEDKRVLAIVNKTDLPMKLDLSVVEKMLKNKKLIRLSLTEKTGLEEVENAIVDMVFGGEIRRKEQVMVTNVRHRNSLEKALHSLNDGISAVRQKLPLDFIEVDYKNAWEYLGEITGDSVGEDLLDHIFSNFCIGK
jgi:tRNA modification GTPase